MRTVPFFRHCIGPDEKQAVMTALDSEFLTTGMFVTEFERRFSEEIGMGYVVGLNSCTAALHLALLACGIGPGDEVITTPMTFAATSLAIIHTGATPVWVDVEESTGNIDANKIEENITPRTKAILPVHLYGQMCDMVRIKEIADEYNLKIIEDSAHAIHASRLYYANGQKGEVFVGQLADVSCYSFYATKSITCGEGGAAATNSKELYEKMKCLRSHGMSSDAATRHWGKYVHWDLLELGWKYNMDNIKASMLIPQISKAVSFREARAICANQSSFF